MFTGIVERTARITDIVSKEIKEDGIRVHLEIQSENELRPWSIPELGASIACDGVCLTVVEVRDGTHLAFDAIPETLKLTTLGDRKPGDRINIEPSLAVGDRFGGHFVTGHVDGMGTIEKIEREGDQVVFQIGASKALITQMIKKGSITVDGISLTLVEVERGGSWFSFAAIPHTLLVTSLGDKKVGDAVNLETDAYGKWVLHGLKEIFSNGESPSSSDDGFNLPGSDALAKKLNDLL